MDITTGTYYAIGDQLHASSAFNPIFFQQGYSVYEVIRIINGQALFLEEHLERLSESVRLSGRDDPYDFVTLPSTLSSLASACDMYIGNIKVVVHFPDRGLPLTYAYFIPHFYPLHESYKLGVNTRLLRSVRNEPNIKSLTSQIRISRMAAPDPSVYEDLLVDMQDRITEGSRSNVFFIAGDKLYTAPDEMVLKGITRKKVITIIKTLNYKLLTIPVAVNDLNTMEAVFLTGTSPKVLPVGAIGAQVFDVDHPFLRHIMLVYDNMIADYLA